MKIKTQLTLASVIAAGLLASGCSSQQMIAQQTAPAVAAPAIVEPVPQTTTVKEVIDCSGCYKPAPVAPRPRPKPRPQGNLHNHPAVAGCTKAVRHNHPHPQGGRHSHKYNCKKPVARPAPIRPAPRPAPRANPDAHAHPAVPNCTRAVSHVHANGRRAHQHRHSCQRPVYRPAPRPVYRPAPQPVVPKVKAKGTYKGPIKIDGMMKQYQQ